MREFQNPHGKNQNNNVLQLGVIQVQLLLRWKGLSNEIDIVEHYLTAFNRDLQRKATGVGISNNQRICAGGPQA